MKKKYKYILFAWLIPLTAIAVLIPVYLLDRYPELGYGIPTVIYVIFTIIAAIGTKRISNKSRLENEMDERNERTEQS